MRRIAFLTACALAMLGLPIGARAAQAQVVSVDTLVLSLVDARRLALLQNPGFLAEQQGVAIARGQLGQAKTYGFNPRIEIETPGLSTDHRLGEYRALLSQEVEWAGQRGARSRVGELGLLRAESEARNAARETLTDVSLAYYGAVAANKRLEVARELFELAEQLRSATRMQAREGEISQLEANLGEIELGRARAVVLRAEREAVSAVLELQRVTGSPFTRVLRPSDETPPLPAPESLRLDSLLDVALARRPDLEAQSRSLAQVDALTTLARREALPNIEVGSLLERGALGEGARIGLVLGLDVPFWNRNQGLVAQRQRESAQAALRRDEVEQSVRAQVTDAFFAYRSASEEARAYETDVLQAVRTNQRLLDTAFLAGKLDLPTLILLRSQLFDAELGYWDSWLTVRTAYVALQAATATLDTLESLQTPRDR